MKHALFTVKANVEDDFDHHTVNWNLAVPGAQLVGFSMSDPVPSTQGVMASAGDSSVVHGARAERRTVIIDMDLGKFKV